MIGFLGHSILLEHVQNAIHLIGIGLGEVNIMNKRFIITSALVGFVLIAAMCLTRYLVVN